MKEWLVIDDVLPALAKMTELGRKLLAQPVDALRACVIHSAMKLGWSVVSHESFAVWARDLAGNSTRQWLVLDPLFDAPSDRRLLHCRISRVFDRGETVLKRSVIVSRHNLPDSALLAGQVGILDDAVSSGRTLQAVTQLLAQSGAPAPDVTVCASSRLARDSYLQWHRGVRWSEFLPGDWNVMHLRDGCPYLPYTGRATGEHVSIGGNGEEVEIRVPTSAINGHMWQVLCINAKVRNVVQQTVSELTEGLGAILDRPPTVADLKLLGDDVAVPRTSEAMQISHATSLASLTTQPAEETQS